MSISLFSFIEETPLRDVDHRKIPITHFCNPIWTGA